MKCVDRLGNIVGIGDFVRVHQDDQVFWAKVQSFRKDKIVCEHGISIFRNQIEKVRENTELIQVLMEF
jgi:hypothetical protein